MNTLKELTENGIDITTANRMLSMYNSKINTMSGIYKIIDINYIFDKKCKDVVLECTRCGNIIHREMVSGRNKWSELIKTCPCQKEEKERQRVADLKNSEKIKKDAILDRIGNEYGDYKIISVDDIENNPKYTMQCVKCGAEKVASAKLFHKIKDFHCTKHYIIPIKFDESYIGRKNNHLTVDGITKSDRGRRFFICRCDCGNVKMVEPSQWEQGLVKSCGCMHFANSIEHSEELDRLRRIYSGMVQRCYNKNSKSYECYGGRGISVCEEWLCDRDRFIEWSVQNGYRNDLSIDRINVNGNYEPDNCRWADAITQANNKRPPEEWKPRERAFEIDGKRYHLYELCEIYNTSEPAIRYRMKVLGMSLEDALKKPKMTNGRPRKRGV